MYVRCLLLCLIFILLICFFVFVTKCSHEYLKLEFTLHTGKTTSKKCVFRTALKKSGYFEAPYYIEIV